MNAPDVTRVYEERLAARKAEHRALVERSSRISSLRGLTALAAIVLAGARIVRPLPPAIWALAGGFALAFLVLVVLHAVLVTRMSVLEERIRLIERGLARIAGEIASFPERGDRYAVPGHPYAGDLDVLGQASLFQLVSAAQTGAGERMLASWLLTPASAVEIAARQEAARELATMTDFREDLAIDGLESGMKGRDVEPLAAWAERRDTAAKDAPRLSKPLVSAGMALVVLTVALLIVGSIFDAQLGVYRHAWVLPFLIQIGVLAALRPAIAPLLAVASSREEPLGRWVPLFRRVEGQALEAPRLRAIRAKLTGASGSDASGAVHSLQRVVGLSELRHSALVHIFANLFLLWDVWCAAGLERWRDRWGGEIRKWLDAIAELEALASLATFAWEHPDYTFPEVDDGPPHLEAEALGHPLIPAKRRVSNDVAFAARGASDGERGGAPEALLVTGSNMSGKSTLLRAVGVAAVLALAGAPVCARRLKIASCAVRTSMRIRDSLEEGVSHFYAELERLKGVVDAADRGQRVLFLLDEVLHGTNSRERNIGAKAIAVHLLSRGAIGAISSHDLGLADLEGETGGRVKNVHFEELVENGKMTFDYTLKPGVVTTSNALRLMKLVGLSIDELPAES